MNKDTIEKTITISSDDLNTGDDTQPRPLYAQVKDFIRTMIETRSGCPTPAFL